MISHLTQTTSNNTRFRSDDAKEYNSFVNGNSYSAISAKQDGYSARLYVAYEETKRMNGFTCFITLTYNEKALKARQAKPECYNQICFDYEDLRSTILHGDFYETITDKYGYEMKYFVGCELGEGKGKRGANNNPHYHALIFIRWKQNEETGELIAPKQTLTPELVLHYAKLDWQGFDVKTDGWHDYKDAKYGICSESEDGILVESDKAIKYVAKYVTKDIATKEMEKEVYQCIYNELLSSDDYYLIRYWNTPIHSEQVNEETGELVEQDAYPERDLAQDAQYDSLLEDLADKAGVAYRKWKNRYSMKVRISNNLGISIYHELVGVDCNTHRPYILVPNDDEMLAKQDLPLYFYRRMYYGYDYYTYYDKHGEKKRSTHYFLNSLGVSQHELELPNRIEYKVKKVNKYYNALCSMTDEQAEKIGTGFAEYKTLDFDKDTIFMNYAIYSLIYKYRTYDDTDYVDNPFDTIPDINPLADYHRFILPCKKRTDNMDAFGKNDNTPFFSGRTSYRKHPCFACTIDIFDFLDDLIDFMDCQRDNKNTKDYEERKRIKQAHNAQKYTMYGTQEFKSNNKKYQ